ncbi:phosphoprotein phosphatase, putative [Leishmania guyanensis]
MSTDPYACLTGQSNSPLSGSHEDDTYESRTPPSSPTPKPRAESSKSNESVFFSSYGSDSVAVAAAASPLCRAGKKSKDCSSTPSDDLPAGLEKPKPPSPSSRSPSQRPARPSTAERIMQPIFALISNSSVLQRTFAATSEKSQGSSVQVPSTLDSAGGATTSEGDGHSSGTIPLIVQVTKSGTEPLQGAPPVSPPRRVSEIPESFQKHPPSIPWKPRFFHNSAGSQSPLGVETHLSTPVLNNARSSSPVCNSPCSSTEQTKEQESSTKSSSLTFKWVECDTSLSSLSVNQEVEWVEQKQTNAFFRVTPRSGEFVPLIEWLLRRGERGDVDAPAASQEDGGECTQAHFFSEDYLMRLCAAATAVLEKEPAVLELEVLEHDTLVVVGDIHGQFQDLYTSVLCLQYDRHQCNLDGRDRRFLFMGDYVDRGPHSLQVVLLLLALKVEYPTLVYLMRGNHEEERTSRVYGFLTEVTSSLGAATGAAVWSAVNKVFLDLPLAAIVQSLYMRFFVTHGGLSPTLQKVDDISRIDRRNYSCGNITADEDDIITGLLWSDPTNEVTMYDRNPRGCGFLFGTSASYTFCADNKFDFICRAHQVTMEGYMWMHNHHVVTVFSAPNYCGVNRNKGAVLVVKGRAWKPIFEQYDRADKDEKALARKEDFAFAAMFM